MGNFSFHSWEPCEETASVVAQVYAQAYDNPIPGYNTKTVGNLRLFEALPETEFELHYFNEGDFPKVTSQAGVLWTRLAGVYYSSTCVAGPIGFILTGSWWSPSSRRRSWLAKAA